MLGVKRGNHRRFGSLAMLAGLGFVLGACSSASGPSAPSFGSMSNVFASFNPRVTTNNTAAAGETTPPNFECPPVTVRQGASTMSAWSGAEQVPTALRHQVSVLTYARECRLNGQTLAMRVGVEGRAVLGPTGTPGTINVPVRIAIVHEGINPKTIVARMHTVTVDLAPGHSNIVFTHIEEDLSFPMPPGGDIDSYVVYVGFDPMAPKEPPKRQQRQQRPRSVT